MNLEGEAQKTKAVKLVAYAFFAISGLLHVTSVVLPRHLPGNEVPVAHTAVPTPFVNAAN